MPDARGRLFADEIAARVGIQTSDWRARVSRGHAPVPAGYVKHAGVLRAVWNPATIDEYLKGRAERLGEAEVREIARDEIERHDYEEGR